jgi:hypothetical protein
MVFIDIGTKGRSEVSIGGLSSKKLNYSIKTIQPISELDANSKAASAPKSILRLSLKALLAMAKLVNFCLLPSGNLTQVATKVDDSAAYGDYYQWGRAKDGHQSSAADGENTL